MKDEPRPAREWLLARHSAAEPKLDALRRAAMHEVTEQPMSAPAYVLRTLFHPHRHFWAGLAAVWFTLLALQFSFGRLQRPPQSDRISSAAIAAWTNQLKTHDTFAQVDPPR